MSFPMKHPRFEIEDRIYAKKRNRILGHNMPWIQFYRRVERVFLLLLHGRFKFVGQKIKSIGKANIET